MELATWGFEPGAVALVTGAASGIGRATALRCAEAGLRVAAWDIDRAGLDDLAATIAATGGVVRVATIDIFDDAAIEHEDLAVGEIGITRIVRDHADRRTRLVQFIEQRHDRFAILRVEIASRLIGQQDRW